ncbi:hypothetical protein V6N11_027100 [Hibiscus sabdariffa]|uniref:Uncharacterized protein n=1 Tax=Hibiscus sabdariffa TaxID=183260 RepID=A0ABR2PGE8_9ROSI
MEKKQEQQRNHKSKINERKGASLKMFGSSSIKGNDDSSLIGGIIEKGIVSTFKVHETRQALINWTFGLGPSSQKVLSFWLKATVECQD